MNIQEAWKLLTLASARDGRTVDREVATVWAHDLVYVNYDDAVEAATTHYRASTAWLMPAHIIQLVAKARPAPALTMSPHVVDCGRHRWLGDGTCNFCETRREVTV